MRSSGAGPADGRPRPPMGATHAGGATGRQPIARHAGRAPARPAATPDARAAPSGLQNPARSGAGHGAVQRSTAGRGAGAGAGSRSARAAGAVTPVRGRRGPAAGGDEPAGARRPQCAWRLLQPRSLQPLQAASCQPVVTVSEPPTTQRVNVVGFSRRDDACEAAAASATARSRCPGSRPAPLDAVRTRAQRPRPRAAGALVPTAPRGRDREPEGTEGPTQLQPRALHARPRNA